MAQEESSPTLGETLEAEVAPEAAAAPTPPPPTPTIAAPVDSLAELRALPGVQVTEYTVRGNTAEEISKQIDLLGPADKSGKRRDVVTQWNISWQWPPGQGGPDWAKTEASSTISIMLPRWEKPETADPELASRWDTYRKALVDHETQRANLIIHTAQRVADSIRFAAASAARFTPQDANNTANKVLRELNAREEALERGAGNFRLLLFPPSSIPTGKRG